MCHSIRSLVTLAYSVCVAASLSCLQVAAGPIVEERRPPASNQQHRLAVCVGINKYPPKAEQSELHFAGKDAIAVADVLLSYCDFDKVILITDVDTEDIEDRFSESMLKVIDEPTEHNISTLTKNLFTESPANKFDLSSSTWLDTRLRHFDWAWTA